MNYPTTPMGARAEKLVLYSSGVRLNSSNWSWSLFLKSNTSPSSKGGDSEMKTARELWEQNRSDPLVKRLNDALSKNSESSEPASSPSASGESAPQGATEEVLYGMNPKQVQSLKAKRDGGSK